MSRSPMERYQALQENHQEAISYENLIRYTQDKESWSVSLEPSLVKNLIKELPSKYIQTMLAEKGFGCITARICSDSQNPGQCVLQLEFPDVPTASNFEIKQCNGTALVSQNKRTLSLTPRHASEVLTSLGITHYGHTSSGDTPILEAILNEYRQKTTLNSSRFYQPIKTERLVPQLINTLTELHEREPAFFHHALTHFLKTLPPFDPSMTLDKIKDFTRNFRRDNAIEKASTTELLVGLILDSEEIKTLNDLSEAITQELVSTKRSPG